MPTQTTPSSSVRERVSYPSLYDVVLLNDDFTPMDFVVSVLTDIFFMPSAKAVEVMMAVHTKGEGVAGTYSYDIACSKAEKGIAAAREEGYPLRLTVKEHT